MRSANSPSPGSSRSCNVAWSGSGSGVGRRVAELDAENGRARNGAQERAVGVAPEVVPGVEHDAAIGPIGRPNDLPGRRQIGDAGPGEELEVDEQAVFGRPVAQPGEGHRRLVEGPRAPEDVHRVERARADGFGDGEQLALAVTEDPLGIVFGRNVDLGGAR